MTTTNTISPSATPTADSTSSVTDGNPDHSNNPLLTPVHILAMDHSCKAGFVVGMILVAVIVVAAIVALVTRRRSNAHRMGAVNPPSIV